MNIEAKAKDQKIKVSERYNDGDYLQKNQTWHVEDSPWKAEQINKIASRNNLAVENVCEVGCGAGEILKQLSQKPRFDGAKFVGYEVSQDAFELCKERESESVSFKLSDILLEKEVNYDLLLCIDVFEHVDNYMAFLKNIRPKAEYKIFHIPLDLSVNSLLRNRLIYSRNSVGHLHYFTPDTALASLQDCGYEIVDSMYTPSFADLPPKTLKAKMAKLPRQLLYKISPKLMTTLLGGCSLMVLAK